MLDINFFIACTDKDLTDKKIILPICTKVENERVICVFTKNEWAEAYMASDILVVKLVAKAWLKQHPVNYGLIVNPTHDACIKFSDRGIQNILKASV